MMKLALIYIYNWIWSKGIQTDLKLTNVVHDECLLESELKENKLLKDKNLVESKENCYKM